MNRTLLLAYQLLTGASDTGTGLLLIFAPALTLSLMRLHVDPVSLTYLSYIGAFVLSVGLACLYGALLAMRPGANQKIQIVWLLTALSRGSVAIFVGSQIYTGALEFGWIVVAVNDGVLAVIQAIGLARGWFDA